MMHLRLSHLPASIAVESIKELTQTPAALDLSGNRLGKMTTGEFLAVARALSQTLPSLTSLDLSENHLDKKTISELISFIQSSPQALFILSLGWNDLKFKSGSEFMDFVQALPKTLISLNLAKNYLGYRTGAELVAFAKALPKLTSLDLYGTELDRKTGTEFVAFTQALPGTLTFLNLGDNNLRKTIGNNLVVFAKALPKKLTTLNLCGNFLGINKSSAELVAFAEALPKSLTSLDLSGNFLTNVDDLIHALPNVTLFLNDRIHYGLVDQLLQQVSVLVAKRSIEGLAFDTINNLPVEIDEACLNQIIPIFERQKTPLADLICGLLLEGRIPNVAEEKYGPLEEKECIEKRTHDAISFYTKASVDPSIRPLTEFLLWEIKQTCALRSVQKRLEEFDLLPTYLLNSFNQTNKKQDGVKLHLLSELGLFKSSPDSSNKQLITESKATPGL